MRCIDYYSILLSDCWWDSLWLFVSSSAAAATSCCVREQRVCEQRQVSLCLFFLSSRFSLLNYQYRKSPLSFSSTVYVCVCLCVCVSEVCVLKCVLNHICFTFECHNNISATAKHVKICQRHFEVPVFSIRDTSYRSGWKCLSSETWRHVLRLMMIGPLIIMSSGQFQAQLQLLWSFLVNILKK